MGVALNPNARWTHIIGTDLVLPFSMCGWARVDTDRNNFTTICWVGDDTTTDHCVLIALNSDGVSPILYDSNFDADITGSAMTVGGWYFLAASAASGTGNFRLYQVAQGGTLALTDSSTYTGTFDGELIGIGGGRPDGEANAVTADASFACWRFWTAALTLAEFQAEMASATPVRTANLYASYRFLDTATATTDDSGNGRTLTATPGTGSFATVADPFTVSPVGALTEIDAMGSAARSASIAAGVVPEVDALLGAQRTRSSLVGAVAEGDVLLGAQRSGSITAGPLPELDVLQPAARTSVRTVGSLAETGALSAAARSTTQVPGALAEIDALAAVGRTSARSVSALTELDALLVAARSGSKQAGTLAELDVLHAPADVPEVGALSETDQLSPAGHATSVVVPALTELDALQGVARSHLHVVGELAEVDLLAPGQPTHEQLVSVLTEIDTLLALIFGEPGSNIQVTVGELRLRHGIGELARRLDATELHQLIEASELRARHIAAELVERYDVGDLEAEP